MKVHLLSSLPPPPPPIPQKAPPTNFELERRAEELVGAAQRQRVQRDQLTRSRRKPSPLREEANSDEGRHQRSGLDIVDLLV
jgi:hypothetical protein